MMDFTVKTKGIEIVKSVPGFHYYLFSYFLLYSYCFYYLTINQGLFSIQTNNNNNIHTFVYMNTERAGNEVKLLI